MQKFFLKARLLLLLLFISFFPQPSYTSVIFSTLLLMDSSSFSAKAFSSLVLTLTNATSLTLHSVESDTITGVQGKRLFAENAKGFYNFQLLHVTRVRSSVEVEDEKTASAIIRFSLPHEALIRGLGTTGIESVEIGEAAAADVHVWLTTTYLELPPFVAQYLLVGWALTVLGFVACVVCYCCCCRRKRRVQSPAAGSDDHHQYNDVATAVVVPVQQQQHFEQPPSAPPLPHAPPQATPRGEGSRLTPPPSAAQPLPPATISPGPTAVNTNKSQPPPAAAQEIPKASSLLPAAVQQNTPAAGSNDAKSSLSKPVIIQVAETSRPPPPSVPPMLPYHRSASSNRLNQASNMEAIRKKLEQRKRSNTSG